MADPTEDQIADAIATAHWWTRRGVCRDGCGCDGCVSSAVLLYLYAKKEEADAHDCFEQIRADDEKRAAPAAVYAPLPLPCSTFTPCFLEGESHNFTCALLCVTCGMPEDQHRPVMDAEDCGHV